MLDKKCWRTSKKYPNTLNHVDIMEFKPSKSCNRYLLVLQDDFTNFILLLLVSRDSENIPERLILYFSLNGIPLILKSDNKFSSELVNN